MKLLILIVTTGLIFGGCTKKRFNFSKRANSSQQVEKSTPENNVIEEEKEKEIMANSTLIWKRYRAFENGISSAMGLTTEQLCTEVGQHSCIDKVHLTVLGGNEPFENAQYERTENPSVLTALAVDRVIVTACNQRINLDKSANPQVFTHFPLNAATVDTQKLKLQATDLYQRFLARDPSDQELAIISAFAENAGNAEQAAFNLCYAIGTQSENIFL